MHETIYAMLRGAHGEASCHASRRPMLHVGVALQDDPVDARLQLLLSQIRYALVDPAQETGQDFAPVQ
jgi:hypothetical protein